MSHKFYVILFSFAKNAPSCSNKPTTAKIWQSLKIQSMTRQKYRLGDVCLVCLSLWIWTSEGLQRLSSSTKLIRGPKTEWIAVGFHTNGVGLLRSTTSSATESNGKSKTYQGKVFWLPSQKVPWFHRVEAASAWSNQPVRFGSFRRQVGPSNPLHRHCHSRQEDWGQMMPFSVISSPLVGFYRKSEAKIDWWHCLAIGCRQD